MTSDADVGILQDAKPKLQLLKSHGKAGGPYPKIINSKMGESSGGSNQFNAISQIGGKNSHNLQTTGKTGVKSTLFKLNNQFKQSGLSLKAECAPQLQDE